MTRRAWAVALALGLYLTLRGYHSRDGDQAHRLPLLLHSQDTSLYRDDPFVRSFDAFNPHRGYLRLLDWASRPLGLSAALFGLFAATFAVTCLAIDLLARRAWPGNGSRVGVAAVLMLLIAKAGNLGTNHLFEAMLLDRLVALALGWAAFASLVGDPTKGRWTAAAFLGAACLVHPSLGLQLGMLAAAGVMLWAVFASLPARSAARGAIAIGIGLLPGVALVAGESARLMDGLSPDEFLTLCAEVQSPQHMLPHLWRMPQWLAGACYPILAALALLDGRSEPCESRRRIALLLAASLLGLLAAWIAIERLGSVRVTIFQPFRVSTVARGLCLVIASGRVLGLWERGDLFGKLRASVLVMGLCGDWSMVAATAFELGATIGGRLGPSGERWMGLLVLCGGLAYLSRHDTESGHLVVLGAAAVPLVGRFAARSGERGERGAGWIRGRAGLALPSPLRDGRANSALRDLRRASLLAASWVVPVAAVAAPWVGEGPLADRLLAHGRFGETPSDDLELLAAWCREHTPPSARFVGPPGPKTFRLWSRREVVFNRSASPYHAAGLADWAERFREHVGFRGSTAEFAALYLKDRLALERRYQDMGDERRADLARRHGANFVLAAAGASSGALEMIRAEGRYAVYRVRESGLASRVR